MHTNTVQYWDEYACAVDLLRVQAVHGHKHKQKHKKSLNPTQIPAQHPHHQNPTQNPLQPHSISLSPSFQSCTTSCEFDAAHELIYVGWEDGFISTYFPLHASLKKYATFKAHSSNVLQTLSIPSVGVSSVAASSFALHSTGGAPLFSARAEDAELSAMIPLDGSTFLIAASKVSGDDPCLLFRADLSRAHHLGGRLDKQRHLKLTSGVSHLCATPLGAVVCGGIDGSISLIDPRQAVGIPQKVTAHGARVVDMDVSNTTLITCGEAKLTPHQQLLRLNQHVPHPSLDPFIKIYDLRMLRQHAMPFQCSPAASFLRFIQPTRHGGLTALVGEPNGAVRTVVDVEQGPNGAAFEQFQQMQTGEGIITSMAVASSAEVAVFTDSGGHVHLWKSSAEASINSYSAPLEGMPKAFPPVTEICDPAYFMLPSTTVSRASILKQAPSWVPQDALGSRLPAELLHLPIKTRPRQEINPKLLKHVQMRHGLGYIPGQTVKLKANALLFGKESNKRAYCSPSATSTSGENDGEEEVEGQDIAGEKLAKMKQLVPPYYKRPTLTQTLGFDFAAYNSTQFSGLEASDPNAFANAILQVLYFEPRVKDCLKEFLTENPNCLATEAGFLFDMLDQARQVKPMRKSCQASNFLRAFRLAQDAQALGLVVPTKLETDQRAGVFIRFLLEQFNATREDLKQDIQAVFGTTFRRVNRWEGKNLDPTEQQVVSMVLDLHYPVELFKAVTTGIHPTAFTFAQLLTKSLKQETRNKLWCEQIRAYNPVNQIKSVKSLPPTLLINVTHENRQAYLPLWRLKVVKEVDKDKPFLPLRIQIRVGDGSPEVRVSDGEAPGDKEWFVYELSAVVSHIYTSDHLVAHVRVPPSYIDKLDLGTSPVGGGEWVLFNDFAVSPSNEKKVIDFTQPYRNPCFVRYERVSDALSEPETRLRSRKSTLITSDIFESPSLSLHAPKTGPASFVQLPPQQLPGKGDLVAIDCEFVALTTEEFTIQQDGTRVVTAPARLSLARVSCINQDGVVFIDDYIVTPEVVEDHLTRFSGLVPGDLDPQTSKHHLVPLRVAYMKLRHLIDRGCIFVGHGLTQDFRVINILVPPENILDTVELFYLGHRKLSLRFLASYLLEEDIQGRTHDSIEDARTALKLYQLYKEFESAGILQDKLTEIFEEGRKRNFR